MLSGWFGSDVYEAYTAAYTWKSNQMAHTMMGFAGTTLLAAGALAAGGSPLFGLAFLAIPISKDLTDLILDRARARSGGGHLNFPVKMRELISDAVTDSFFWSFGMVLALTVMTTVRGDPSSCLSIVFLILSGVMFATVLVGPGRYYLQEKQAFDLTGLPYYFRLPNFSGAFRDPGAPASIRDFLSDTNRDAHIVIFGPPGAGKTSLGVGIGSDLTVTRKLTGQVPAVRYISATKLIEALDMGLTNRAAEGEPHPIGEADVLIVDDLPKSFDASHEPIDDARRTAWRTLLKKSAIWIVSNEANAPDWEAWITEHKPSSKKLKMIGLARALSSSEPRQYSILRLEWLGLFPLLGIAIPVTSAGAAIFALSQRDFPGHLFWCFFGFGLLVALLAEIVMIARRRPKTR